MPTWQRLYTNQYFRATEASLLRYTDYLCYTLMQTRIKNDDSDDDTTAITMMSEYVVLMQAFLMKGKKESSVVFATIPFTSFNFLSLVGFECSFKISSLAKYKQD